MLATETPEYLLFIKNRAELEKFKHQLNYELELNQKLKPYNKNQCGCLNFNISKGVINQEAHKQALHIQCRKGDGNLIKKLNMPMGEFS